MANWPWFNIVHSKGHWILSKYPIIHHTMTICFTAAFKAQNGTAITTWQAARAIFFRQYLAKLIVR